MKMRNYELVYKIILC